MRHTPIIAYLGNSLTVQKNGYRPQLHLLLEKQFGESIQQINAGLGGMGSLACSGLIDLLVLRHRPQLCLVECSAADMLGATPSSQVGGSIETILRGLLENEVEPLLLHLPLQNEPKQIQFTLDAYKKVAEQYCINTISLWNRWIPHAGALLKDGIHLNSKGGLEVAQEILSLFDLNLIQGRDWSPLPDPLNVDRTQWLASAAKDPQITPTAACRISSFRLTLPLLEIPVGHHVIIQPLTGASITGLLVVADNQSGVVKLSNDASKESVQIYDQWCEKPRLQIILLDPTIKGALKLSMTNSSTADRNCRYKEAPMVNSGTVLRFIGATFSGLPPKRNSQWWQHYSR